MSEQKTISKKNIATQIIRIILLLLLIGLNVLFINIVRGLYVGGAFLVFLEECQGEYAPGYWLEFALVSWSWYPLYILMLPPLSAGPMELFTILLGIIVRKKEVKRGFLKIFSIIMLINLIINALASAAYLILGIIMTANAKWTEIMMIKGVTSTTFIMSAGLFIWVIAALILYLIFFLIDKNRS